MTGAPPSAQMQTYIIPKGGATVDIGSQLGDRILVSFDAGSHTPKNETEEQALEHLAALGLVTKSKAKES